MSGFYEVPPISSLLLFASEAVLFLVVAAYCLVGLRRGSRGRLWAAVGVFGGLLGALLPTVVTYSLARVRWAGDFRFDDALDSGRFLSHLVWARPVAVLLVGTALVLAARGTGRPSGRDALRRAGRRGRRRRPAGAR